MTIIYKICDQDEWTAAEAAGAYDGSDHDKRDGFIHFSTKDQLTGTLAKHYWGLDNLVLIAFDASTFGDTLKWEKARNNDLFPHLYASLPTSAAVSVTPIPINGNGKHILPDELQP